MKIDKEKFLLSQDDLNLPEERLAKSAQLQGRIGQLSTEAIRAFKDQEFNGAMSLSEQAEILRQAQEKLQKDIGVVNRLELAKKQIPILLSQAEKAANKNFPTDSIISDGMAFLESYFSANLEYSQVILVKLLDLKAYITGLRRGEQDKEAIQLHTILDKLSIHFSYLDNVD